MPTFFMDKDEDVWAVADDGTLVCISRGEAAFLMRNGESISLDETKRRFGPLVPLVPDGSKCYDQIAPGIVCERDKHDDETPHTTRSSSGNRVTWS